MAISETSNIESGENLSAIVGSVESVTGLVAIVRSNGTQITAEIGDAIFKDDTLVTGARSAVVIRAIDGSTHALGANAELVFDEAVLPSQTGFDGTETAVSAEAIEQALLAGADPTEILEPPGAGGPPASAGGFDFVVVDRTAARATPESGFETEGLSFEFPELLDEVFIVDSEPGIQLGSSRVEDPPDVGIRGEVLDDASAVEGTPLVFRVSLSKAGAGPITLDLLATDGTATGDGVDYASTGFEVSTDGGISYVPAAGPNQTQITFVTGQTELLVRLATIEDSHREPDETMVLSVRSVVAGDVNDATDTAIGTIFDINTAAAVTEAALADANDDGSQLDPAQPGISDIAIGTLPAAGGVITGLSVLSGPGGGAQLTDNGDSFTLRAMDGSWSLEVEKDSASYAFSIADSQQHPNPGEAFANDTIALQIQYDFSFSAGRTANATLTVNIHDDKPMAIEVSNEGSNPSPVDTNLIVILDRSGSMREDPGVTGFASRLDLAREAVAQMFDRYDLLGDVNIRIVDFNEIAKLGPWFDGADSVAQANAFLDSLAPGGDTNYQDALAKARTAFDELPVDTSSAHHNFVYFLSDGKPTAGGENGDFLPLRDVMAWEAFLSDPQHPVEKSFAVGIGTGVPAKGGNLDKVAFPDNDNANPIVVLDENQLIDTLLQTVSPPITGNVGANDDTPGTSSFGADGGFIRSVTVDGVSYGFDPDRREISTNTGTIPGTVLMLGTMLGGMFEFDFGDGRYRYAPPEVSNTQTESFQYSLEDGDGDVSTNTLSLTINNGGVTALARGDTILTNAAPGETLKIPDWVLLDNDVAADSDPLTVSGVVEVPGGGDPSIAGANVIHVPPANFPSAAASFQYTANDSAPATTIVKGVIGNTASGTDAADILVGASGDDILNGGGGNDILFGGDGNDILRGGGGDNILSGGQGSDIYIDDAASRNSIKLTPEDLDNSTDTAFGFDNSADPRWGDRIDIADILDFAGFDQNTHAVSDFVSVAIDASNGDVTMGIDLNGSATFTDVLVLRSEPGMNSSDIAGPVSRGSYTGTSLEQMLSDGVLIIS